MGLWNPAVGLSGPAPFGLHTRTLQQGGSCSRDLDVGLLVSCSCVTAVSKCCHVLPSVGRGVLFRLVCFQMNRRILLFKNITQIHPAASSVVWGIVARMRGWSARKSRTPTFSENTNNNKTKRPIFNTVWKSKQYRALPLTGKVLRELSSWEFTCVWKCRSGCLAYRVGGVGKLLG